MPEQPIPLHQPGVRSIHAAVRADLSEREHAGIHGYGTPLQPLNGRDALQDLYEALLDATCSIRQEIAERDDQTLPAQLSQARQALQRERDLTAELRKVITSLRRQLDQTYTKCPAAGLAAGSEVRDAG